MIAASPSFEAWEPLLADLAQRHADLPDLALKAREAGYLPKECMAIDTATPELWFRREFPTAAAEGRG